MDVLGVHVSLPLHAIEAPLDSTQPRLDVSHGGHQQVELVLDSLEAFMHRIEMRVLSCLGRSSMSRSISGKTIARWNRARAMIPDRTPLPAPLC